MKYYLKDSVFEATEKRIRFIFEEFPEVILWYSGGKDSTVIFHMTINIARELNRLPLKVAFIDQESEWKFTIDLVKKIMYNPDVYPLWYQFPFRLSNSVSQNEDFLHCWDNIEREGWQREKDPISIKENRYNCDRFHYLFEAILATDFPNIKVGGISGVRTEESPGRHNGLTSSVTYKWVTWARKYKNPNHINFYPIYDWSYTDIWKAILDNNWEYNKIYDYQYRYGLVIQDMRVSSLHHETAIKSLFYMQEIDINAYNSLINRLPGINTAAHLGSEGNFYIKDLPFMFVDWKEYRITDNRLHEKSFWDPEKLKLEFRELESVVGFSNEEIENILKLRDINEIEYTDEEILKEQEKQDKKFDRINEEVAKDRIVMICPNCLETFQVSKTEMQKQIDGKLKV